MKKFLIFLLIITCAEIGVYWHYDKLLNDQETNHSVTVNKSSKMARDKLKELVNEKVKTISMSDNQQFIAYINENDELHVVNLNSGKDLYSTTDENNMVYLKWIRNDRLFIGIKTDQNELILKTYQIGDDQERTIKTFSGVTDTSTFKEITYSPFTNDVYVLIGNDFITKMYHFDTNGQISNIPLFNSFIENPMMLSTKDELYYEDKYNNIWVHKDNYTQRFKGEAKLLAVYDDTLYYGKLNGDEKVETVYSYQDGDSKEIFALTKPVKSTNILVNKDESLIIANGSHYFNTYTNKTYKIPSNAKIEVENHQMFISTDNKTYIINE